MKNNVKKIVALELEQITSKLGYEITESEITLGEQGEVAAVSLYVQQKQKGIEVAEVQIGEETVEKEECIILQEAVMAYYQLEEDAVSVYQ